MLGRLLRICVSYLNSIFNAGARVLNLGTTDIWGGIILCCEIVLRRRVVV